jgi:hypothetical protein
VHLRHLLQTFLPNYVNHMLIEGSIHFHLKTNAANIIQRHWYRYLLLKTITNEALDNNNRLHGNLRRQLSHKVYRFKSRFNDSTYRRVWGREEYIPEEGWPIPTDTWKALLHSESLQDTLPPVSYTNGFKTTTSTLYHTMRGYNSSRKHYEDHWVSIPVEVVHVPRIAELPTSITSQPLYQRTVTRSPYRYYLPMPGLNKVASTHGVEAYTPKWIDEMRSSISTLHPTSQLLDCPVDPAFLYKNTSFDPAHKASLANNLDRGRFTPQSSEVTKSQGIIPSLSSQGRNLLNSNTFNNGIDRPKLTVKPFFNTRTWEYTQAEELLRRSPWTYEVVDSPTMTKFTRSGPLRKVKNKLRFKYTWMPRRALIPALQDIRIVPFTNTSEQVMSTMMKGGDGTLTMRSLLTPVIKESELAEDPLEPYLLTVSGEELMLSTSKTVLHKTNKFTPKGEFIVQAVEDAPSVQFPHPYPWLC